MWPTESDLVFFIWENRKKKKRRENATTMRLADFRWLSIRCDAIRFDSIRRRTVARCAGPRFRFGRFALVDQISRERERENEWNGATFSPFLYFSGEGGERETGGTHQKQNGGGAKDDDDDDDDDVRITDASFTFASPFLRPVLHFFVVAANGFGAFISRVFVSHGHRSPSRTGP